MRLFKDFWDDQSGAIVSAELIAVSTVGVLGSTVGLSMLATSVNGEFQELSHAVRSLNQSYAVHGRTSCGAWTAGSAYTQPDVRKSIAELDAAFVGDLAQPPKDSKPEAKKKRKSGKSGEKKSDDDAAAFLIPDESSLGEADVLEPDDDASKAETTIEAAPEV